MSQADFEILKQSQAEAPAIEDGFPRIIVQRI